MQSDGFTMNKVILTGDKDRRDIADFCFKRLAIKKGILRKSCDGTKPTKSMRFLISPPNADE